MHSDRLVELSSESFQDTHLLRVPAFEGISGFAHAITTKPWNMALHQGPQHEQSIQRRKQLCRHLGFRFERLTAPDQIHSPHVLQVMPIDVGAGREGRETAIQFTDGLICDLSGVPLMQFSADCPIVVLIEPGRRIIGTAHASWRGTVAGITAELVHQLKQEFAIDPTALIAAICPCAGPGEYEVGEIVRRIALSRLEDADRFFTPTRDRYFFDLRAANVDQLIRGGLLPQNMSIASASTISDTRFYSHRREGPSTGRFAFIGGFVDS
jgi:YfiH family protein